MSAPSVGYTVDHVGFTVPDLDAAIAFFVDGIGCRLLYQEGPFSDPDGDSMERDLEVHPRSSLRSAMVQHGSTTTIELLEYTSPERAGAPPSNADHSAGHVALRVRDIEAAIEQLRAIDGVELLAGPNTIEDGPSAGLKWIYFRAPWGLQLELCELPPAMAAELEAG